MKKTFITLQIVIFALVITLNGSLAEENRDYPKRLKRSESFLGIHFDFHAGNDCTEIGKDVDRKMIEYIIDTRLSRIMSRQTARVTGGLQAIRQMSETGRPVSSAIH